MPLPGASTFPTLLAMSTMVILFAGAADAILWSQAVVSTEIETKAIDARSELEYLRMENERLRRHNIELTLDLAEIVEAEQRRILSETPPVPDYHQKHLDVAPHAFVQWDVK